jgi:hypothetical protein
MLGSREFLRRVQIVKGYDTTARLTLLRWPGDRFVVYRIVPFDTVDITFILHLSELVVAATTTQIKLSTALRNALNALAFYVVSDTRQTRHATFPNSLLLSCVYKLRGG